MTCPSSLIAGDTWSWGVVDTDRSPANGWSDAQVDELFIEADAI